MPNDFENITNPKEAEQAGAHMGEMLASGIGVGLEQNSVDAVTAMEGVYVELETVTKNAAKNAENLAKKRQKRQLANLKNSLELELITEQEYYEKLKKYRDENLRQGTDAWFSVTEEIVKYNKKLLDDAAKAETQYQKLVEKAVQKAENLQQRLQESLKSSEDWATRQKITIHGANPDGSKLVFTKSDLQDFDSEIRQLEKYRDLILGLKNLGNIPMGVFEEIGKMEVADAITAAEVLLGATPEKLAEFIEGYNTREALTGSIASEFNALFNGEEIRKAGADCAEAFQNGCFGDDPQQSAFIKTLRESFETVPPSYYTLGQNSGTAFAEGFVKEADGILDRIQRVVSQGTAGIASGLSAPLTIGTVLDGGTSNVFNTTYTFNASKDTTTMQLSAAKNAATLERLRGGV